MTELAGAQMNPKWWRQAMALLLAGSMALSGCATKPGTSSGADSGDSSSGSSAIKDPELAADEAALQEDANLFNSTVAGGAALGAGVGILAGVLIGATTGRIDNMVRYGIAGGLAGGVLGGVDGYMTATAQEASRKRIRQIDVITRDVQKDNENSEKLIESSKRFVESADRRIQEINTEVATKQTSIESARAERAQIEKSRNLMADRLADLKKKRDGYQQASAKLQGQEDTSALDAEIRRLNEQVATLEQTVVAMNQALAVSKV